MNRYFPCILTVALQWKCALKYLVLLLERQWKRPTEWQCNSTYELKQNILNFAFLRKQILICFQPQNIDYCIILEMSVKGRQVQNVKRVCQVCDKYTFPLALRSAPHPLEQINLSWKLDFCIWDENQSLISLTVQGCGTLWQQNAITLTLTAGNGVGLAESVWQWSYDSLFASSFKIHM